MNQGQKIIIWVGLSVIMAMGLFPPWDMEIFNESHAMFLARQGLPYIGEHDVWYKFITNGSGVSFDSTSVFLDEETRRFVDEAGLHKKGQEYTISWEGHINTARLLIQWVIVAAIACGMVLGLKDKKAMKQTESCTPSN